MPPEYCIGCGPLQFSRRRKVNSESLGPPAAMSPGHTGVMKCPNCGSSLTPLDLPAHQGRSVTVDVCAACHAFWFDRHESLKLSPAATLKLMKFVGEHTASATASPWVELCCPRCSGSLVRTQDMQRTTRFSYWRCASDHGRFIRFFDFLKEKNFIRPLTAQQLAELRQHVQSVNCSNCGAPVNLAHRSICEHCKTPLSMLDMQQPSALLKQLEDASVPRPVDPALPLGLARAKRDVDLLFGDMETGTEWWKQVATSGLVEAGLGVLARWLVRSA